MPLQKTTIYPDQNPDTVIAQPIIKFVVLGDYPIIVGKADAVAQGSYVVERKVIWYKTIPDNLHNRFSGLPDDISNIKAFSCSTINKTAHTILLTENADNVRILLAYADAGKSSLN